MEEASELGQDRWEGITNTPREQVWDQHGLYVSVAGRRDERSLQQQPALHRNEAGHAGDESHTSLLVRNCHHRQCDLHSIYDHDHIYFLVYSFGHFGCQFSCPAALVNWAVCVFPPEQVDCCRHL